VGPYGWWPKSGHSRDASLHPGREAGRLAQSAPIRKGCIGNKSFLFLFLKKEDSSFSEEKEAKRLLFLG
jgi:hypothetical protein